MMADKIHHGYSVCCVCGREIRYVGPVIIDGKEHYYADHQCPDDDRRENIRKGHDDRFVYDNKSFDDRLRDGFRAMRGWTIG